MGGILKSFRAKPELSHSIVTFNMHMQWFPAIAWVEEETVWPLPHDGRHRSPATLPDIPQLREQFAHDGRLSRGGVGMPGSREGGTTGEWSAISEALVRACNRGCHDGVGRVDERTGVSYIAPNGALLTPPGLRALLSARRA